MSTIKFLNFLKNTISVGITSLGFASTCVYASGDFEDNWRTRIPALQPANDSRQNLFLLSFDAFRQAAVNGKRDLTVFDTMSYDRDGSSYIGAYSVCVPIDPATDPYVVQVNQKSLPKKEKAALLAARKNLSTYCEAQATVSGFEKEWRGITFTQTISQGYRDYLLAAGEFYDHRIPKAIERFSALRSHPDAWLAETATYMVARLSLLLATDDPESPNKIKYSQNALSLLQQYLDQYGKKPSKERGLYLDSARGLVRRAHWAMADWKALESDYARLLDSPQDANVTLAELSLEIDNKLFGAVLWTDVGDGRSCKLPDPAKLQVLKHPKLIATAFLVGLRQQTCKPKLNQRPMLAFLKSKQANFKDHEDLFHYLLAVYAFSIDNDVQGASAELVQAKKSNTTSTLNFSIDALRATMLLYQRQPETEAAWSALIQQYPHADQKTYARLGYAVTQEHLGDLGKIVLDPANPDTEIQQQLLDQVADTALMRQVLAAQTKVPRSVTIGLLLRDDLLYGAYTDFARDLAYLENLKPPAKSEDRSLVNSPWFFKEKPKGQDSLSDAKTMVFACPTIPKIAERLAVTPTDPKSLLCLGEVIREQAWNVPNRDPVILNSLRPDMLTLGASGKRMTGQRANRAEIYQRVMNDASASKNDRAYALYRAIACYAPGGTSECGKQEDRKARQQWFKRLKTEFKGTVWSDNAAYWW